MTCAPRAATSTTNPRVCLVAGGFHLVVANDSDIEKVVSGLHDQFKVEYVAPGHCTGELPSARSRS